MKPKQVKTSITTVTLSPDYGEPWLCQICGKTFKSPRNYALNCCVLHSPGSCCHYGDTEVKEKHIDGIHKSKKKG